MTDTTERPTVREHITRDWKYPAALAGLFCAIAVVLALAVTLNSNHHLANAVDGNGNQAECRSRAQADVNGAIAEVLTTLSKQQTALDLIVSEAVRGKVPAASADDLDRASALLATATEALEMATEAQKAIIAGCNGA